MLDTGNGYIQSSHGRSSSDGRLRWLVGLIWLTNKRISVSADRHSVRQHWRAVLLPRQCRCRTWLDRGIPLLPKGKLAIVRHARLLD
jgi:hypothetical protein